MKDRYSFIVIFDVTKSGISIEFPDLPGCLPCADTMEEALKNDHEALGLHLCGIEQDGEEIPKATEIQDITLEKNQVSAIVEAFMPSFRDKLNSSFIKKL